MLRAGWDDPLVADFAENIDRVNGIAERFPGVVWRLGDGEMESAQLDVTGPNDWADNARVASTLSVWENVEVLKKICIQRDPRPVSSQGAEWFLPRHLPRPVLWHIEVGTLPTIENATCRMKHLMKNGSSEFAFDFDYLAGIGRS